VEIILGIMRLLRNEMDFFSRLHFFMIPLAPYVHVAVAFTLTLILRKFFSAKISTGIVLFLVFLKETLDIFAKSSLQYITPPTIETPVDIIAGILGIVLAFVFIKKTAKWKKLKWRTVK
jgi:hypothetical protein